MRLGGDFPGLPRSKDDDEQQQQPSSLGQGFPNGAKAWGGNIWGNSALGSGFGKPAARDQSRSRDNGSYPSLGDDAIEGKTGSGSLLASSETDPWVRKRSSIWAAADSAVQPATQTRPSGVSPGRQRTASQIATTQAFIDSSQPTSSPYFSARAATLGPGTVSKPAKPMMDPASANFNASRQADAVTNGFGSFGRVSDDGHFASWVDSSSVHSPADDRRSITNSDYFGAGSANASRSGSLPPSRHGAEPVQFPQPAETLSRFSQLQGAHASMRGMSSFASQANGRAREDRSDSIHSDSMPPMFGRLSLDNGPEPPMMMPKPSINSGAIPGQFQQAQQAQHDPSLHRRSIAEVSQNHHLALEDNGFQGSYTPEGYPSTQFDHFGALRNYQLTAASRGAMTPNSNDYRQSPYISAAPTPPVFDQLNPWRNEQNMRANPSGHSTILEQKLKGLEQQGLQQPRFQQPGFQQQEQAQQAFFAPQYQQALAAQFRAYNSYQFALPNGMPLNGMNPLQPPIPLPNMSGVMPNMEPPKGPRDQDQPNFRSTLLEEFKSSKVSRRFELKDIYDHVTEFSGDQHGSRFIQQKLETANSDDKEMIFREIQPNAMQLMTDVFGNYVIQKFFEHGDQTQKKALANKMKGHVLNLSLQMYGCRVVQKALEHVLTDQQAALVKELENNVLKCVRDQNGNHVIQKAIERVPAEHIQFIINAFTGQVASLANHPYGCRVIQRMLEYCEEPAKRSILQELHACGSTLIPDQYGNYVTQNIIERGDPEDRARVISLVKANLFVFSKHKFASNVVEKCLVHGNDEQKREIMEKILEKGERGDTVLYMLIKDGYGNYVIQKLLDTLNAKDYAIFIEHLHPEMAKAKRNATNGKNIQAVEKKMHRFSDVHRNSTSPSALNTTAATAGAVAGSASAPSPPTNDSQSLPGPALASAAEDPVQTTPNTDL
ncbi:armadillo-type protein [Lineolata rhizophorae]|uniref:Pumilio homology domain family member 3 n=1 Tax=Lineolata rhizophorae TaxID=578093 RepID=A0A6A6NS00_9PEZI|nr:armadillo-type protein [Lineolata rhizophorae]